MAIKYLLGILFGLALLGSSGCGCVCPRWCRDHPGECCQAQPTGCCSPNTGLYAAPANPVPVGVPAGQKTCTCTCN